MSSSTTTTGPFSHPVSLSPTRPHSTSITQTHAHEQNHNPSPLLQGSLQTRHFTKITLLPLKSLLRPIPPVLDESKITRMIQTLQSNVPPSQCDFQFHPGKLPPVDVLHYKQKRRNEDTGELEERDFYFAFGACHRLQAYERTGVDVECKVLKATRGMLEVYLGASVGRILGEN